MIVTPVLVADTRCLTGEGPMWHPTERAVYWVDIPEGLLYRFDVATGTYAVVYRADGMLGGYTFQADGGILTFESKGAIHVVRNGKIERTIHADIPAEREGRFNDVIADPEGRVFCGTMPIGDRPGKLYRLDRDGSLHVAFEDAGLSNGMGFTLDLKQMYHNDSSENRITTVSEYDRATGALSNRRVIFHPGPADGLPDGMTVDAEGYIWSAQWDGACLLRLDPAGNIVRRVHFPAKKVSSITFGSDGLRDAFVTTAGGGNRAVEGDGAGALFRADLGVAGRPEFLSRVQI